MQEDSNTENKPKRYLIPLLTIFVLILIILLTLFLLKNRTSFFGRAQGEIDSSLPSLTSDQNSYVFASPVRAKAARGGAGEMIRVTVFILDSRGFGIPGKKLSLGDATHILTVKETQAVTDDTGMGFFDVSSNFPGAFIVEVTSDGKTLSQKAKITYD